MAPVTADDFEAGPEQNAFLVVQAHAVNLLDEKKPGTREEMLEALRFFFSGEDDGGITFDLCCEVLRARADVIRLRIQYEFWMRGVYFTGPFSGFTAVQCPWIIAREIGVHASGLGLMSSQIALAMASEVWAQPGITTEELHEVVKPNGFLGEAVTPELTLKICGALAAEYILSKNNGWYLTGRNPLLQNADRDRMFGHPTADRGRSVHWSSLFGSHESG